MPKIKLQSSDHQVYHVDLVVARQFGLIKSMLENLGEDARDSEEPLLLPNVSGAILKKIIKWTTYHREDLQSSQGKTRAKRTAAEINTWQTNFFKVDQGTLFEIILGANYLDVRDLLEVGCKSVADMMEGKTPEEIRTLFNIQNDFTPEEEERLRLENEWAENL